MDVEKFALAVSYRDLRNSAAFQDLLGGIEDETAMAERLAANPPSGATQQEKYELYLRWSERKKIVLEMTESIANAENLLREEESND